MRRIIALVCLTSGTALVLAQEPAPPAGGLDDVLLLAATELTTDADIAALTKELAGACA